MGPFGNGGAIHKTYNVSESYKGVIVSFKLALLDSWNNETFYVVANGKQVFSINYTYTDSPSNTCQSFWGDRYIDVTFGFNHTSTTIGFIFGSNLDEASENEAWGICGLSINFTETYVTAIGKRISAVNPFTFSCISQEMDSDWTYSPAYNTITCGGNTYVGGFSSGGSMSANLSISEEHLGIIVRFKLMLLESWEQGSFVVTADGNTVYTITPSSKESSSETCQDTWPAQYIEVSFGFNHTSDTVAFIFSSTLDESSSEQTWGICDLFIQVSSKVVTSTGYPLGGLTLPYDFACASNAKNLYWVYVPYFSEITCNGNVFVGAYGAGASMSAYLRVAQEHKGIIMSLKLALIDSWEGETFTMKADGETILSYTHSNSLSSSNTCQESWGDTYVDFRFGFNHSAEMVLFELSSTLDEQASDEAWGICDLSVSPILYYVTSNGFPMGEAKPLSFSCLSPTYDSTWTYVPAFSTVNCSSNTFLGGFGAGGSVSTTLFLLDWHQGVIISFRLALFDFWEGESFVVNADGYDVFTYTHEYDESSGDFCGASWGDTFIDVKFGLNHSVNWIHLNFTSTLTESANTQAWGICNFQISATYGSVHPSGYEFGSLKQSQFSCQSPNKDQDWIFFPTYTTLTCADSTYVGGYAAGGNIYTNLYIAQPHNGIVVRFNLLFTGNWTDSDIFTVLADDEAVFATRYQYNETSSNSCGKSWDDTMIAVKFGFNHTAGFVKLLFTSNLASSSNDESWGICDLEINPVVGYVDHLGNELGAIRALTFSCSSPSISEEWEYNPYYSTVSCSDSGTFVGAYGSGGEMNTTLAIHQLHNGLVISFKLALFDYWDNQRFMVTLDEKVVYSIQYDYSDSLNEYEEEESVFSSKETCEGTSENYIIDVRFGVNHTATNVSLVLSSDISQSGEEKSWGICDLSIETTEWPVDAEGNTL